MMLQTAPYFLVEINFNQLKINRKIMQAFKICIIKHKLLIVVQIIKNNTLRKTQDKKNCLYCEKIGENWTRTVSVVRKIIHRLDVIIEQNSRHLEHPFYCCVLINNALFLQTCMNVFEICGLKIYVI